jgi:hypothetical protein
MDVESTSAAVPSQESAARRPIGEFLVERGLVTDEQLKQALAEQRSSGKRLGEILVERGAITRMALASVLGEQWEEAGRHLRKVVPVRLAGGKEADEGLAGGEELTDSLASLQSAVARLEELSGGPSGEQAAGEDSPIETALAELREQIAELRNAVAAPMVVETDHLGERLAELDAFLRGREEGSSSRVEQAVEALGSHVDARLSELAEATSRPLEPDREVGERLGRIESWLREHDDGALGASVEAAVGQLGERLARIEVPAAVDPELAERLGRLEALLSEHSEAVPPELAHRLDEIAAAAERPRDEAVVERLERLEEVLSHREQPMVDIGPLWERLDLLNGTVTQLGEALSAPVAEAPTEAIVARLETLEQSLGAVREAVESPRDDGIGQTLLARLDEMRGALERDPSLELTARLGSLEEALGGQHHAWEAAVERLGHMEGSLREALERPVSKSGDAVAEWPAPAADPGFGDELFRRLDELRAAVESARHDGVGERLGQLEDAVRAAAEWPAPAADPGFGEELFRRLDDLRAVVEAPRDDSRLDEVLRRLDGFHGELAARHERLPSEETIRALLDERATHSHDRLARIEERLEESQRAASESTDASDALAERLGAALAAGFAEVHAAIEQPRDDRGAIADLDAALAERDARIAELVEQLETRPASPTPTSDRPRPGETTSFVALVPASDGYRLVGLEGMLPAPGDGLEVPDDDRPLVVARLGRSPYPGDARPCAYLLAG